MKSLWIDHGTKLLGGAVTAMGMFAALQPDQVAAIAAMFGNSSPGVAMAITGILTIYRGFKNSQIKIDSGKANSPLLVVILAVLLIAATLPGCATLQQNSGTSSLVVQYATTKVIEQGRTTDERLVRAQRVKAIAVEAKSWLNGEGVSIAFLEQAARARIAKLNLETSDLLLANALIQTAVQELQAKIGDGVISPGKLLTVNQLLSWIESAASLYGA